MIDFEQEFASTAFNELIRLVGGNHDEPVCNSILNKQSAFSTWHLAGVGLQSLEESGQPMGAFGNTSLSG